MAGRKNRIVQPGDGEVVQLGLFSVENTGDFRKLEDYPPVYRDEEGFRRVIAGVTDLCGLDFEFNTKTLRPTVIGVSNDTECAAVWYTKEILDFLEAERKARGFRYSGHAVLTADRQVLEAAAGETTLQDWSDSILSFWLANADLCKQPGKEEDVDGGLGFMSLGVMASLTTDLPHHKTCRGRNCEELICPRHDVRGYCAIDAYVGLIGDRVSQALAARYGVPSSALTFMHELQELAKKMQDLGIAADREYISTLAGAMEEEQAKLFPIKGDEKYVFNPRSPKEVGEWFREHKVFIKSADKDSIQTALEKRAAECGFTAERFEDLRELLERSENLDPVLEVLFRLYTYKVLGKGTDSWFHQRYFGADGYLHPRFVCTGTSTGRFSSSSPNFQNCFSGDTEILTERGWQRFDQLDRGVKVAQWHSGIRGEITFAVPSDYIEQKFTGQMVHLESEHIDLMVTEDHRCPVYSRRSFNLKVWPAKDYRGDHIQPNAGRWLEGGLNESAPYLQLLIATQADGHLNGYGISFKFKKRRKFDRLVEILKALDVEYSESHNMQAAGLYHVVYVKKSPIVNRIWSDLGGEEKRLPDWFRNLDYDGRKLVVKEVTQWDGLARQASEYYSKDKRNCDLIQWLAATVGIRTKLSRYTNTSGNSVWILRYTQRDYSMTTNVKKTFIDVVDYPVYCVTVPSSFVVVRRQGSVMVSGNCPKRGWGKRVRKAIVPRDKENVIVEADFSQLELRIILYLAGIDQSVIGEDAFSWLVTKSGGLFDKAAQRFGGKPRDIAKSVSHGANYMEGFRLISLSELSYSRVRSEYEAGALRIYHPDYNSAVSKPWMFGGKVVAFTGSNLAQRLFGSKTLENRKKALEIQEDIYFGAFGEIREFQQRATQESEARGYVLAPTGRFLRLNDTPEKNAKLIVAFLGQGVGAAHVQSIMLQFYRRHRQVFMMTIHDALVGEFRKADGYEFIYSRMKEMEEETPLLPGFTCPVKVEVGENWGAMEGLFRHDGKLYVGDEKKPKEWREVE